MNNNNITYIDPDHTWATSAGTLNMNLYYKDNLHLIEKGNEKLAKAIITAFNVRDLKHQQNLPEISQQQQQERPQHQQKHQQNQQGNGRSIGRIPKASKRTTKANTQIPATSKRTSTASRRNQETSGRTTTAQTT